jgi:outer membrane protein TolC
MFRLIVRALCAPRRAACLLALSLTTALAHPAPDTPALALRDALARALAHDPQVASARALVDAARALSGQARSRLWPSAGVTASYGRGTDAEPPNVFERSTNRSEAFLRWHLFNGMADRTAIDAQKLEEAAAEADLVRAVNEACDRLGAAYFELLRQQRLISFAQARLDEVGQLVQRVQRQAELGKGSDADAQLAAASLIDARLALQTIVSNHAVAQTQLRVLLGGAPGPGLRVADEAPPPVDAEQPLDTWQQRVQQRNGQWAAAAARAAVAQARVAKIEPEYLPRVDLDLRKRLHDRTAPANTSAQQRGWTVSLTYEVPLGGGPAARRDEARARAAAAEAELRRVADAVHAELGSQRLAVLAAREAAPQLTRQREHLDAVVRASALQYDAGRRSLQQLIDQQDRRFEVQQRDTDNAWRLATSQWRLRMLAGELADWFEVDLPPGP